MPHNFNQIINLTNLESTGKKYLLLLLVSTYFIFSGCNSEAETDTAILNATATDGELPEWNTTEKYLLGIRANDPINRNLRMDWFVEEYGDEWSLNKI